MKLMWVSRSSWSFAARITEGGRCPTVWTPMPPPRSTYTFPSASRTRGPSAHVTSIGRPIRTPLVTNFDFRATAAFDFGPGGTVTIFGPRIRWDGGRFAMRFDSEEDPFGSLPRRERDIGVIGFPSERPSGERRAFRLRTEGRGDQAAREHEDRNARQRPQPAPGRRIEARKDERRQDRCHLADSFRQAETGRAVLRREEFRRVGVHGAPGPEIEEADEEEADDERPEISRRREDVATEASEDQEEREGPLPAPAIDEEERGRIARELREGGEDQEQRQRVGVPEIHDPEPRERRRKPEEEPVIAEVQRDPHADRHDRAAQQVAPEQRGHGGPRDRRLRGELRARHFRPGHGPQDARGLLEAALPGQVERALRDRPPKEERDERGKRGRNEQEAPGTAELDHEHVPECDRDEEPRGPEEIEEDHVSPAVLRRQVFRQDRRIDDKEATEADARKHPQEEKAGDVEGEGRQGRESGIAQDARLEQEPSAAGIRETAQRQAADQGPHEGRRRDGAVGKGIPRGEGPEIEDPELGPDDGEHQADEDDFEGHEGPRESRDEDDASMKRGESPAAEDVLHRARRADHGARSAERYMRVRGTAVTGRRGARFRRPGTRGGPRGSGPAAGTPSHRRRRTAPDSRRPDGTRLGRPRRRGRGSE